MIVFKVLFSAILISTALAVSNDQVDSKETHPDFFGFFFFNFILNDLTYFN